MLLSALQSQILEFFSASIRGQSYWIHPITISYFQVNENLCTVPPFLGSDPCNYLCSSVGAVFNLWSMSGAYLRDLFPAGGVSCFGGKTAHYMALPYKIGVVAPLLADTQHLLPYTMGVYRCLVYQRRTRCLCLTDLQHGVFLPWFTDKQHLLLMTACPTT